MRILFYFLLLLLSLTGCNKKDSNKDTVINVQVVDSVGGLVKNFNVYRMTKEKFDAHGLNLIFKDEEKETNDEGVVTFNIPDAAFADSANQQYYFFGEYQSKGVSKKTYTTAQISKGEIQNVGLLLD